MANDNPVIVDKRGQALWIVISRQERRNALNGDVISGIASAYRRATDDNDIRVIVLTGAGDKAFCAGADLQPGGAFSFDAATPGNPFADLLRLAHASSKPSIARVNGACMAGGMGLLCMTDIAVAADHAQFGLPEVKLGLFPMQVLSLLQMLAPRRLVHEWCITGEPFDAAQAQTAGLVNHVVPAAQLDAKVDWLAQRIANNSPTAIRRGKHALRSIAAMSFEESIAFTESQIALTAQTADAREGMAAFREKRSPNWSGR